jgi:O-antigen biosynthesis protein
VVTRKGYWPTVSVVICTRDRPQQLDRCLASLASLDYPAYHVLVVDNAPRDQRSREVALHRGVQYLVEPVRGLSRARNRGARSCGSEIVAYIDDDAVPEPDWLMLLVRDFEDPRVAAVTGAILPMHRNPGMSPPRERTSLYRTERGRRRAVGRETQGWFEIANFGEMGDGSNMAFRHIVFDIWPGFDERLGRGAILNGGEEHYAFFTLIERGYRIVYNPGAIVRHPDPQTAQELRSRHLSVIATATAYVTYLAVEHPSCRRALARYALDRLRGTTRPWVNRSSRAGIPVAPRWLTLLAILSGAWTYFRSRMVVQTSTGRDEMLPQSLEATPMAGSALQDRTSP